MNEAKHELLDVDGTPDTKTTYVIIQHSAEVPFSFAFMVVDYDPTGLWIVFMDCSVEAKVSWDWWERLSCADAE